MVTRRVDSIKELNKRKTNEQLTRENAALRKQVSGLKTQVEQSLQAQESLETQLTDTQMALCDVYELLEGGAEQ